MSSNKTNNLNQTTDGPWLYMQPNDQTCHIVTPDGDEIFTMFVTERSWTQSELEANAALVVRAPQMLALLQECAGLLPRDSALLAKVTEIVDRYGPPAPASASAPAAQIGVYPGNPLDRTFRVVFETDIMGEHDPVSAAREARRHILESDDQFVWKVTDPNGVEHSIDLQEIDNDENDAPSMG